MGKHSADEAAVPVETPVVVEQPSRRPRASARWWLASLPAVALAVVASSYTYFEIARPQTFSSPISVAVGQSGHLHETTTIDDPSMRGSSTRDVVARVDASGPIDREAVPFFHPPEASRLWGVRFTVDADPDDDLLNCTAQLVDDKGNVYGYSEQLLNMDAGTDLPISQVYACVPGKTPGNVAGLPPRPAHYSAMLIFVLPEGVTPQVFRMGFQPPKILEFQLPESSDVLSSSS
ncbi:hypothetical protein [Corynebacterium aquilae]|uniref:Uncharacterized protein n=1 Tax=Corynebacterium aquilae DSM 44791 TaxID=1431546 RepID=A0A1L7CFJ2_9CORY|nr:hypothetical protein [Corynebacterium aquilae]APT84543.1 hypothetical protein CAQU_05140 [Corynebacterium aquilae DSM 44791]